MVDRNSFLQAPLHHLWVMGSSLTCENNSHITLCPYLRFLLLLPVELVQKRWSWTRIRETQRDHLASSPTATLSGARGWWKRLPEEGSPPPLPPPCVISALRLRGRCSRAQQHTVIQGWRGAEAAPVLRPLSTPPRPSEEQKFPRNTVSKTTR